MSGRRALALLVLAAAALRCAAPARPRIPETQDYVFPTAAAGELRGDEPRRLDAAWRDVLAGRGPEAERAYLKLLSSRPGLVPAETGLGYARLRSGRLEAAERAFGAALERRPDYLPALLGAAQVARAAGKSEEALARYRRAQELAPRDPVVQKRVGEVKLQVTERRVAAAHEALAAGDGARAMGELRAALEAAPELGGLRVELAELLLAEGDADAAVALLGADPADDRQVLLRLGALQGERGRPADALEAYRRILKRDPKDAEALGGAAAARQALELQQMPPEYRRLLTAPRLTRADLAALLAVKVTALARVESAPPPVAVDISGSWAREHILSALSWGLLEVYPNHTFQPGAVVRRGELAFAVARCLDLLRWPAGEAPAPRDMSVNNLYQAAASRVVGAGLMDLTPDGAFEPWRPVSGPDAVAVVEALTRLLGP